jgi:hypothetical protein
MIPFALANNNSNHYIFLFSLPILLYVELFEQTFSQQVLLFVWFSGSVSIFHNANFSNAKPGTSLLEDV